MPELSELVLVAPGEDKSRLEKAAERGTIIGEGANIARTLSNRSSNDVSPEVLAEEAYTLAKKHGPALVDEAAKAALDLGVPTYHFLRRYLERRLPAPLTLRQVDPLIRQLTLYRDLIDRKTGDRP